MMVSSMLILLVFHFEVQIEFTNILDLPNDAVQPVLFRRRMWSREMEHELDVKMQRKRVDRCPCDFLLR